MRGLRAFLARPERWRSPAPPGAQSLLLRRAPRHRDQHHPRRRAQSRERLHWPVFPRARGIHGGGSVCLVVADTVLRLHAGCLGLGDDDGISPRAAPRRIARRTHGARGRRAIAAVEGRLPRDRHARFQRDHQGSHPERRTARRTARARRDGAAHELLLDLRVRCDHHLRRREPRELHLWARLPRGARR